MMIEQSAEILTDEQLKCLIEAAIFVAEQPISVQELKQTVLAQYKMSNKRIIAQINRLSEDYHGHGVELMQVATGYRFQAVARYSQQLASLYKERTPRYSRALLETLSLIAYQQPITRGVIEDIRGVAVSSYIMKTLLERNWIKIVGHKEVPGRPALYATTNEFLDYFSLTSLDELPEPVAIEKILLPELSVTKAQAILTKEPEA